MALDTFRTIPITLDLASDPIEPIRLNGGDIDGRHLLVSITDGGKAVTDETLTADLRWNTSPDDPNSAGGYTHMTRTTVPYDDATTIAFDAVIPRTLLTGNAPSASLGIAIMDGDTVTVSRTFTAIIAPSVLNATAPAILDPLQELHNAADTASRAAADAADAVNRANSAVTAANDAVSAANTVIADASLTAGNTTTLDPDQQATSSLDGTGLQRTLNLGIPRGAGISDVAITTVKPSETATATLSDGDHGDKTLNLSLPRAPRVVEASTRYVIPSATASTQVRQNDDGDTILAFNLPRGATVATVSATTLDTGQDATVSSSKNLDGDINLTFGLPRGEKGEQGDRGDAGQVATREVAGVVKPGPAMTITEDGTLGVSDDWYALPVATDHRLGGVMQGAGVSISDDGTLAVKIASYARHTGKGVPVLLSADGDVLTVPIGSGLSVDSTGVLSATASGGGLRISYLGWLNDDTIISAPTYASVSDMLSVEGAKTSRHVATYIGMSDLTIPSGLQFSFLIAGASQSDLVELASKLTAIRISSYSFSSGVSGFVSTIPVAAKASAGGILFTTTGDGETRGGICRVALIGS